MIGLKVNNYEIVSLLGEGGMGAVYVAQHPVLGRRVAVKVLKREFAEDKQLVTRFMNEARAATAIKQPNIIEIMDVGTLPNGVPYLMMELLEGESLASRLRREKRLSAEDAIPIAAQAATALAAAHDKQIVHRDLKPDNLYLVPDETAPRGQRLVVLDFGIAKLRGELSSGSVKTHTGSVMGTPPYMSPEQCRGLVEEIDHRTDIYAMGIIIHEMLTGETPFVSAGFGDLLMMHLLRPPPPLRSIDPSIPPYLEAVVLRALEKPREARFASMAELKSALLGAVGMPVATKPGGYGAPAGGRGANEAPGAGPESVNTLTSSSGEMLAPDAISTVRERLRRRSPAVAAFVVGGGVAAALVIGLTSRPASRSPPPPPPTAASAPTAAAPTAGPAIAPALAPAAAPAPSAPAPVRLPTTAARSAAASSAPGEPKARGGEPEGEARGGEPEHRESARATKRAPAHATRSRAHAGEPASAVAPPAPAPTPSAAPAAPPAKPAPKLSADKW